MKINDATPPVQHPNSQPAAERDPKAADPSSRQPRTDRVEISSDAKRLLAGNVDAPSGSAGVSKTSETNPTSGHQDSVEVGNSVDRLTKALTSAGLFAEEEEAHKVATDILEKMRSVPSSEEGRLDSIRQKVESGFYGSREVAEVVAEKLLKEIAGSD